ncbi:hypothetical protein SDRG_11201 [Saprolegnia diclina VS20]|uniref:Uncharacterized protein n=1 Tax=Saprolegnia diclina (strain VS20) TaxID=1156394 RepID=T0PZM5_SAPDV|nr:hypothetical protein SDRG_11201 [Saprolegnia diclina VS20]EQC31014.1 hypothetical protein SDRG_11201 [Saprolegnia diclina VS20]|eukprot:XP_008615453.1 hypothetical protein SDRG_11201 [Saprolegnia diclina VS20]
MRDRMDHRSAAQKMKSPKVRNHAHKVLVTEPGPVSTAYRYVTRSAAPVDTAQLPCIFDVMNAVHNDYDAFQYLNLNAVGQLFRDAWNELIQTVGCTGYALEDGDSSREMPILQSLLGLCDSDSNDPRVTIVALALMRVAKRMHEAYVMP